MLTALLCFTLSLNACSNDADVAKTTTNQGYELTKSNIAPDTLPDISDTDYAAFVNSANQFGLELAQEVTNSNSTTKTKNGVFSPISALMSLAMLYGGAENEVAAAMKATLHDELPAGQYHVAQNRLRRELQSYNYEGSGSSGETLRIEIEPANSLFAEKTVAIKSAFLDLLGQQYDSGVYLTDFLNDPDTARSAINGWVEDKTHNRIKELLQPGDVTRDTTFVLVNGMYLYASWQDRFLSTETTKAAFTTLAGQNVIVDIMHQTESFLYKATSPFEIVKLPYANNKLFLTLVLPKAGSFEAVRDAITNDWLQEATSDLSPTGIKLGLPKFSVETEQLKLMDALGNLGLWKAGKDITGISTTPVVVDDVIQKAFIGTNEAGTEAAAATAVTLTRGSAIESVPLTFDRPFLFFVQTEGGLVLFSGQIVDPTSTS
jgi:serpin B